MHKLLDFGLARAAPAEQHERSAHMTDTLLAHTKDGNHQAGTPHYMSPEHWSPEWGKVDVITLLNTSLSLATRSCSVVIKRLVRRRRHAQICGRWVSWHTRLVRHC